MIDNQPIDPVVTGSAGLICSKWVTFLLKTNKLILIVIVKMDIFNKKIIIGTHYLVYGAPQALREYLIKHRIKKLFFIAYPLLKFI